MNNKRGGTFSGLIIGLAIGVIAGFFFAWRYGVPGVPSGTGGTRAPAVEQPAAPPSGSASDDYVERKLREWNLTPDALKRELSQAGEAIVRKGKEIGGSIGGAAGDVRIVAVIKAKFTLDERLSALDIVVRSDQGHVSLEGSVSSSEHIGRAIVLALDTSGVVDVVSKLRVKG